MLRRQVEFSEERATYYVVIKFIQTFLEIIKVIAAILRILYIKINLLSFLFFVEIPMRIVKDFCTLLRTTGTLSLAFAFAARNEILIISHRSFF